MDWRRTIEDIEYIQGKLMKTLGVPKGIIEASEMGYKSSLKECYMYKRISDFLFDNNVIINKT